MDILKASPSAVKLYYVLLRLRDGDKPFAASTKRLMDLAAMGYGTVVTARQELVNMGAVRVAIPSGYYLLTLEPIQKLDTSNGVTTPFENLQKSPIHTKPVRKRKGEPLRGIRKSDRVEERRAAVKKACAIMRVPESARYVQKAMASLYGLLVDGFTLEDALEVARYCRDEYDRGDRFKKRLNLLYIWSVREFSTLLAAARTTPFHSKELSNIDDPDTRKEWSDDYQRRVRERGLA